MIGSLTYAGWARTMSAGAVGALMLSSGDALGDERLFPELDPIVLRELAATPAAVEFQPAADPQDKSAPSETAQPTEEKNEPGSELKSGAELEPFGRVGQNWLRFGGGVAYDFADATDVNAYVSYSFFLADDVELIGEWGLWYYSQPGDDSLGMNALAIFRWHFYNEGKWSIYGDIGIGLVGSTEPVPEGGRELNFTPRAGIGFTREIADDGTRLEVGVRWAHTSNARVSGDLDNPGRDAVMLYVGLAIPMP